MIFHEPSFSEIELGRGLSRLTTTKTWAMSNRIHISILGWSFWEAPMISPRKNSIFSENKLSGWPLRSIQIGIEVRSGRRCDVLELHSWKISGMSPICQKWRWKTRERICGFSIRNRTVFGLRNWASIFEGFSWDIHKWLTVAWTLHMCGASPMKKPTT